VRCAVVALAPVILSAAAPPPSPDPDPDPAAAAAAAEAVVVVLVLKRAATAPPLRGTVQIAVVFPPRCVMALVLVPLVLAASSSELPATRIMPSLYANPLRARFAPATETQTTDPLNTRFTGL